MFYRYFLLQAALIPIHCLRRNSSHPDAPAWRAQVMTALNIITAMNNINPSAQKCRDVFYRLCGDSLPRPSHEDQFTQSPPPQQNAGESQDRYSFQRSDTASSGHERSNMQSGVTANTNSMGSDPWMQEIDTAIDGYDVYVNRLTNAAAGTDRNMAGWGGPVDSFAVGINTAATGDVQDVQDWGQAGMDMPNGMQDWDWGLML
jgi:hypothetical protein